MLTLVLSIIGSNASAGNCDKFFLNIFCKKTWKSIERVIKKNNTKDRTLCTISFGLDHPSCQRLGVLPVFED